MTFHLQVVAGIHYTAGMRHAIVSQQLIDKIDPNREIETQNEVRMSFFSSSSSECEFRTENCDKESAGR